MQRLAWALGLVGGFLVLLFLAHRAVVGPDTLFTGVGGLGAALLVLYLWLDREDISSASRSRAVRYSSGAALSTALALGVAVAINILGQRYDQRWDWTASGKYTLSDHSLSVARGLAEPVQVLGFFVTGSTEESAFRDLLEGYLQETDKLTLEMIDPDLQPLLAKEYAITSSFGTVVLVQGDRQQRLETDFEEEALTNALIRLGSAVEHVLCFTQGHGEREVDDEMGEGGIGGLVIKLEGQNYTAKTFVPLREGQVPADCEVVIVAGPQQDLLPPELELLARWVAGGGDLIVLLDALDPVDATAADLGRYGFKVGRDLVLEADPRFSLPGMDYSTIVLDKSSFDFHPITNELQSLALLRIARSVDVRADLAGVKLQVLARTSEQSFAETTLGDGVNIPANPDPGVDLISRVPVIAVAEIEDPAVIPVGAFDMGSSGLNLTAPAEPAVDPTAEPAVEPAADPAAEAAPADPAGEAVPAAAPPGAELVRKPGAKVVVFGDSDFATTLLIGQGQNQDLIFNTIAWMVDEEDQLASRESEGDSSTMTLTEAQGLLLALMALIAAPGLAVMAAFGSWMRRRAL